MREREDEMKVRHWQEFDTSCFDPTFFGERLALRAVPVATRMVDRSTRSTAVASLPVPTESRCTTGFDGAQGAELDRGQSLCAAHVASVEANDVREFWLRVSLCRRPVRERTGHDSVAHGLREIQQVERRTAVGDVVPGQMQVTHR